MNIHFPFKRQALAGALALTLVAACLPAAPQQPTAAPAPTLALTLPPTAALAPTADAALTPAAQASVTPAPTATFTKAASDLSKLPDPLEGWQQGDRSVAITITEYGDFQ
jgi:hypothetical protein